ncbi:hypothetical protein ACOMHN_031026 [Nucella lapillus]
MMEVVVEEVEEVVVVFWGLAGRAEDVSQGEGGRGVVVVEVVEEVVVVFWGLAGRAEDVARVREGEVLKWWRWWWMRWRRW